MSGVSTRFRYIPFVLLACKWWRTVQQMPHGNAGGAHETMVTMASWRSDRFKVMSYTMSLLCLFYHSPTQSSFLSQYSFQIALDQSVAHPQMMQKSRKVPTFDVLLVTHVFFSVFTLVVSLGPRPDNLYRWKFYPAMSRPDIWWTWLVCLQMADLPPIYEYLWSFLWDHDKIASNYGNWQSIFDSTERLILFIRSCQWM